MRTIYDRGGASYEGEYENEKADIINAFKTACVDIVKTLHNNEMEYNKIDFVVTQSYSMYEVESNVKYKVEQNIQLMNDNFLVRTIKKITRLILVIFCYNNFTYSNV